MSTPGWQQPGGGGDGWQQPTPGGGWQQPGGHPPARPQDEAPPPQDAVPSPPAGSVPPPGYFPPPGYVPPAGSAPVPPGGYEPYGGSQPYGGYQPFRSDAGQLAGWWRRVAATLVDDVFVGFALFLLLLIIGAAVPDSNTASDAQNALVVVLVILGLVGTAYYYVALVAVSGRTLGNRVAGTRVVDARSGRVPGWGKAAGLFFVRLLLAVFVVPLVLDVLWPLWDERRQTLHDKVAGTVVVTT